MQKPRRKKSDLRRRAESRLQETGERSIAGAPLADVQKLVHELQVHQTELEIQNDELIAARAELQAAHDRYRELYDYAPVGYVTIDPRGVVTDANLAAARMLGLARSSMIGQSFHRFVVDGDERTYFAHRREILEDARESHCEIRLLGEDGGLRDVLLQSTAVTAENGETVSQRTIVTDITARKSAEAAWHEADLIIEAAAEAVVVIGRDRRVSRVNPAFTALCGYDQTGIVKHDFAELLDDDADSRLVAEMWRTVSQCGAWRGEVTIRPRQGAPFAADASLVEVYDERGDRTGYACLFTDITERKRAEQQLRERAFRDALTGLPNRGAFLERIRSDAADAQRHGHMLGLLLIDLDHLKETNDQHSHAAGDALLQSAAERLARSVRGYDTVARIGGDEFAVILTDIDQVQGVASITEKILRRFARPVTFEGRELACEVSIGVAVFPIDAQETEALAHCADLALYRAKGDGGGTYRFFRESMTRQAREHSRVERELSRALRRGEFRVAYQPIAHAESGALVGAEALCRWANPERGLLLPEPFLAVAEDTGQIMAIGAWMIDNAAAQWLHWRDERGGEAGPFLAFNVSPRQLIYPTAFEQTIEQLRNCGLGPEQLCLEVTEGVAMNAGGKGREHLHALKRLGVSLAMDDFGTGYSALGSLKDLPFDIIKIDRTFIRDLETNEDAAHLVHAIVHMAHDLRLRVIAEGVESAEQLRFVRAAGCDFVQGYHVCPPLDADAMCRVLDEGLPAPGEPVTPADEGIQ